jgi:hypothetical protein
MPVAQQGDQHPVDQVSLTDDKAARMGFELLECFCDAHSVLRWAKRRAIVVVMREQSNTSAVICLTGSN